MNCFCSSAPTRSATYRNGMSRVASLKPPAFSSWEGRKAPPLTVRNFADRLGLPLDAVRMEVIQAPLIDISSRDLHRRAAEERSLRYLLPRTVECYIHDKRLYRADAPPA